MWVMNQQKTGIVNLSQVTSISINIGRKSIVARIIGDVNGNSIIYDLGYYNSIEECKNVLDLINSYIVREIDTFTFKMPEASSQVI